MILKEKHARQARTIAIGFIVCQASRTTEQCSIKVVEAFFQADSALAALYKKGIVDVIMSSDLDFAVYVPDCLLLQDFRFVKAAKRNQAALDKIQVASGLKTNIECGLDARKYSHDSNKVSKGGALTFRKPL